MVILATKIYVKGNARNRAIRSLDSIIFNDIGQLDVTYDLSFTPQNFPEITVNGEDEMVANNILRCFPSLLSGSLNKGLIKSDILIVVIVCDYAKCSLSIV